MQNNVQIVEEAKRRLGKLVLNVLQLVSLEVVPEKPRTGPSYPH